MVVRKVRWPPPSWTLQVATPHSAKRISKRHFLLSDECIPRSGFVRTAFSDGWKLHIRTAAYVGVLALSFIALAAACGDDDEGTDASPTPTGSAQNSGSAGTEDCKAEVGKGVSSPTMAFAPDQFCLRWKDSFSDESGFRIKLSYPRTGESFVHDVGSNATSFVFPAEEGQTPGNCERSPMTLELQVVKPSGAAIVDAIVFQNECPG